MGMGSVEKSQTGQEAVGVVVFVWRRWNLWWQPDLYPNLTISHDLYKINKQYTLEYRSLYIFWVIAFFFYNLPRIANTDISESIFDQPNQKNRKK